MLCFWSSHFLNFKCLLVGALGLSLVACSGGGEGGGGNEGGGVSGSVLPAFGDLGLTWAVPDKREDGENLLNTEIAGYRVYYGSVAGDYQNQVDVDNSLNVVQIPSIPAGKYYVVVTVVDTDGRESLYSPEVEVTI